MLQRTPRAVTSSSKAERSALSAGRRVLERRIAVNTVRPSHIPYGSGTVLVPTAMTMRSAEIS